MGYDAGVFFVDVGGTIYTETEFCVGHSYSADGVYNGYAQMHVPPEKSASLTAGVRLLDEKLTLGGRLTYIGARSAEAMEVPGGGTVIIKWTPHTLLDLFASYKVSDDLRFDMTVDNVTDVYYMDVLNLDLMPSPGRTGRVGLTAKF